MVAGCACRFDFGYIDEAEWQEAEAALVVFINLIYAEHLNLLCIAKNVMFDNQLWRNVSQRIHRGTPIFMVETAMQVFLTSNIICIRRD